MDIAKLSYNHQEIASTHFLYMPARIRSIRTTPGNEGLSFGIQKVDIVLGHLPIPSNHLSVVKERSCMRPAT